jgi:hypothetical protein
VNEWPCPANFQLSMHSPVKPYKAGLSNFNFGVPKLLFFQF